MKPTFWKLSQGADYFSYEEILQSIEDRLVYVHKDTPALAQTSVTQGQAFKDANIGDYFYLTYGNTGVFVLGQFTGPINYFSGWGEGWSDRPFRIISRSTTRDRYTGVQKWWSPNHNSTFVRVPENCNPPQNTGR